MKLHNVHSNNKGFTLVELAIVIAIMGILFAASFSLLRLQNTAGHYKATKTHLKAAKEAIIAFAMTNGRLPYTDGNDDNITDGYEDTVTLDKSCGYKPCYLPWMTLSFKEFDPWNQHLRYDVNDYLLTTNNSNICAILYEISLHQTDNKENTVLPCVTSTSDTIDNGQIDTDTNSNPLGYSVSAVIISDSELAEGASYPNLTGKNADTDREYEMEATGFDKSRPYNDQVAELTVNELMARLCSNDNTFIKLYGHTEEQGSQVDEEETGTGNGNGNGNGEGDEDEDEDDNGHGHGHGWGWNFGSHGNCNHGHHGGNGGQGNGGQGNGGQGNGGQGNGGQGNGQDDNQDGDQSQGGDSIEILSSGKCINLSTTPYVVLKIGQSYKYYKNSNSCNGSYITKTFTEAAQIDFAGNKNGAIYGDGTDR